MYDTQYNDSYDFISAALVNKANQSIDSPSKNIVSDEEIFLKFYWAYLSKTR